MAAVLAVVLLAVSLPGFLSAREEQAWASAHETPTPASLESVLDGSALGESSKGYFSVSARSLPEVTARASRAGERREPRPLPYLPVASPKGKKGKAVAVVKFPEEASPSGSKAEVREFLVVVEKGARLPADAVQAFSAADSKVSWQDLPVFLEGPPSARDAWRRTVLFALLLTLSALALLGVLVDRRRSDPESSS